MDGQDSPYQVAAPCWLAELTLKVNMLEITIIMMIMVVLMAMMKGFLCTP